MKLGLLALLWAIIFAVISLASMTSQGNTDPFDPRSFPEDYRRDTCAYIVRSEKGEEAKRLWDEWECNDFIKTTVKCMAKECK